MPKKSAKEGGQKKLERQTPLPGMEDAVMQEIESAALDYADGRDERMAATENEVHLKEKIIAVMHKHGKTDYKHGKIEVHLKVEKETVKVKIHKDEEKAKASSAAE